MTVGYWVHGVQIVNAGDEPCSACGQRKAVGRSVGGHVLCPRCAGWAAHEAEEYAREVEAARARRAARQPDTIIPNPPVPVREAGSLTERLKRKPARFRCGHSGKAHNVYLIPSSGYYVCRTCQSERFAKARAHRRKAT
jgi:DNA-directed RNA polymerase subunit RPC12/RpoP